MAPNRNRKPVKREIGADNRIIYRCPKCGEPWTQKKKAHRNLCMKCGQYLDWAGAEEMHCVTLYCQNLEEAYYAYLKYREAAKADWGPDPDTWRLSTGRIWPKALMFPFPEKTGYGRFMRWVAKDGPVRVVDA